MTAALSSCLWKVVPSAEPAIVQETMLTLTLEGDKWDEWPVLLRSQSLEIPIAPLTGLQFYYERQWEQHLQDFNFIMKGNGEPRKGF